MTLFSLARKNIQRNLSNYFLYIASMVFSIVIYFTFVTLKYNDDLSALKQSSQQIKGLMSASSVVLLFFIVIFMAYSNSFFMKKRKKEVALYSLLGVRKQKIGLMLFFENLVIGLVSLVLGIGLGFFMSQGLLMILVRLMGYEIVGSLTFSVEALLNTAVIFTILFLFTSLQGYRVIYQFKLIDLFHAEKQGEQIPRASLVAAVLGTALIAFGYYTASSDMFTSEIWRFFTVLGTPLMVIGVTIVGTYLLFHSVSVFVLTALKRATSWSWKGLNLIGVSQLLYRIRANAKSLSIIAILSATTITAGGGVFGMYYNAEASVRQMLPNTFMWKGDPVEFSQKDVIYHESLSVKNLRVDNEFSFFEYTLLKESDYNRLAKLQGKDQNLHIAGGSAVLLDAAYDERFSHDFTGEDFKLKNGDSFHVEKMYTESVLNFIPAGTVLVVNDQEFAATNAEEVKMQAIGLDNDLKQQAVSKDIVKQLSTEQQESFSSVPQSYEDSIATVGALLFVGSFLGLVFLAATGSIIYFKILTEAEEDQAKYAILNKIGVNSKQILKTVAGQVAVIFSAPLIVGIVHSAFALLAFSQLFGMNITKPVILWMIAYSAIYFIYYIFTVRSFYKIVRQGN
ncbi:FtsX-like permease family protein [Lysinibacillus fusiformis]|uniref:Putative ABC transport system permease protein n=1 Tax=Lysinibacillus fusiformis TaxID=28031 RepID=A0A1H9PPJ5_9BACI|nr:MULTISPECIES: FtsX-like permease family protein [Lysinibacillus]MED4667874.1 FtsX-like permease family protein [Lysinibacillus fusiformis]NOG29608.1 FtsX-like permease family protein [Lysinibacillus fusiformis]QAS58239.1 ABC transporter permease [Lysinibacillus sphaericus]RDV31690.1 ABC transporter permease [Lysinibacillus fusiformis]SCX66271.1 putative ABC transport system permease protein [Lysinibacillus fusiformis]